VLLYLLYFCLSTCSCMHVLTTQFSIHVYDSNLSVHMCLSLHAIWHSHHHSLGSSDSPGSSCPDPGAKSWWILPVADQSSAAEAWIIGRPSRPYPSRPPARLSSFSSVTRERLFVQFIIAYLFIFSHLRLSMM